MKPPNWEKLPTDEEYEFRMNWKEFIGSDGEVEHVIPLNKVAHLVAVKYQARRLSVLGLVDEETKKPFKIIDYCQPDIDSEKQMIKKYWR